jgi:hypoxanthine phosphoribosyltransferase
MREVFNYIESRGATMVKTATFLDKPKARKVPFEPDYIGFSIEPQFVVGYGLDFAERYRNIPEVQVLSD